MTVVEVFADVCCPFTHVGLCRLVQRRRELGSDIVLRVRAWPLELVNGAPLDAGLIAEEVEELRQQVAPDLFARFEVTRFPPTSLPALGLAAAAYRRDACVGRASQLAATRCPVRGRPRHLTTRGADPDRRSSRAARSDLRSPAGPRRLGGRASTAASSVRPTSSSVTRTSSARRCASSASMAAFVSPATGPDSTSSSSAALGTSCDDRGTRRTSFSAVALPLRRCRCRWRRPRAAPRTLGASGSVAVGGRSRHRVCCRPASWR